MDNLTFVFANKQPYMHTVVFATSVYLLCYVEVILTGLTIKLVHDVHNKIIQMTIHDFVSFYQLHVPSTCTCNNSQVLSVLLSIISIDH